MAVPLENIFYLLCYAHGHANDISLVPSGHELGERTENLFAHILVTVTSRLLRRGIARRYCGVQEEFRGVRGKIAIGPTLSRSLLSRGQLACQFDELSPDITENQLLKAACYELVSSPFVTQKYRTALADILRQLAPISDLRLTEQQFAPLAKHPPRGDYALGLAVARLVATGALPRPDGTAGAFIPFEADQRRMGALFEDFIRGFLTVELPEAHLLKQRSAWQAEGSVESLSLLPALIRDIPYVLGGQRVVLECKFYENPLAKMRFGARKLRASHLNQIFTYLSNDHPAARGLLLYAASPESFSATFTLQGHHIDVRTLDLNQNWQKIRKEALVILGRGLARE